MLEGTWRGEGVYNVEQLDPDPFIADLNRYGLPIKEVFMGRSALPLQATIARHAAASNRFNKSPPRWRVAGLGDKAVRLPATDAVACVLFVGIGTIRCGVFSSELQLPCQKPISQAEKAYRLLSRQSWPCRRLRDAAPTHAGTRLLARQLHSIEVAAVCLPRH
jgi:hypothetical protein